MPNPNPTAVFDLSLPHWRRPLSIGLAVYAACTVAGIGHLALLALWRPALLQRMFLGADADIVGKYPVLIAFATLWIMAGALLAAARFRRIHAGNIVFVMAFCAAILLHVNVFRERGWFGDYGTYVRAAANMAEGKSLPDRYLYPPAWAAFLSVFHWLGGRDLTALVCFVANQFSFILLFPLLVRCLERLGCKSTPAALLTLAAVTLNVPILRNMGYLQVNLIVLDLVLLAILLYPRYRILSAIALALGVHLKLFPIVFVPLFLWRGSRPSSRCLSKAATGPSSRCLSKAATGPSSRCLSKAAIVPAASASSRCLSKAAIVPAASAGSESQHLPCRLGEPAPTEPAPTEPAPVDWRWLVAFSSAMALVVLVTVIPYGTSYYVEFFRNLRGWQDIEPRSASTDTFLILSGQALNLPAGLMRAVALAVKACLAALCLWTVWRRMKAEGGGEEECSVFGVQCSVQNPTAPGASSRCLSKAAIVSATGAGSESQHLLGRDSRDDRGLRAGLPLLFLFPIMAPTVWVHHLVMIIPVTLALALKLHKPAEILVFLTGCALTFWMPAFDMFPLASLRLIGWLLLFVALLCKRG